MISRSEMMMDDGARWQVYHLPSGSVTLTSKGRELFRAHPETRRQLHAYRAAIVGRTTMDGACVTRQYFASGSNADVYSASKDLVIKETLPGTSLFSSLLRMDRLVSVVERHVPRWIDIPDHYALLDSNTLSRQYLLMQKVDSGITVEDVVNPGANNDRDMRNIALEMGNLTDEQRAEIYSQ